MLHHNWGWKREEWGSYSLLLSFSIKLMMNSEWHRQLSILFCRVIMELCRPKSSWLMIALFATHLTVDTIKSNKRVSPSPLFGEYKYVDRFCRPAIQSLTHWFLLLTVLSTVSMYSPSDWWDPWLMTSRPRQERNRSLSRQAADMTENVLVCLMGTGSHITCPCPFFFLSIDGKNPSKGVYIMSV